VKAPHQTESQLQRQIVQALPLVLKPGVMWTHFPAGGARDRVSGAMLKADGLHAGWPDLQFAFQGRACFLELKRKGGRLSAAQRDVIDALRANGFAVEVAHSFDEAMAALGSWKLVRGTVALQLSRPVASASETQTTRGSR
jgi:VRR-NUC domain